MASYTKVNGGSNSFTQWGLFICAGALFIAGVSLGFAGEPASAGATLTAGVICLIFAFLSKFKRFKGLGVEAELWEEKQEEAAQLIETLRSLSAVVSQQLVNMSARMGRWDSGTTHKELFGLTEQLEKILKSVDVPPNEREEMKAGLYRYTAIDMALPIMETINKAVSVKVAEQQKVLQGFGSPVRDLEGHRRASDRLRAISSQKGDWKKIVPLAPSYAFYESIEKIIEGADSLTVDERAKLRASVSEEMADLQEWITRRRLRRPEQWFAEDGR